MTLLDIAISPTPAEVMSHYWPYIVIGLVVLISAIVAVVLIVKLSKKKK